MGMQHWWSDTDRENQIILRKNCPSASLSTTNPRWMGLWSNSGLYGTRLLIKWLTPWSRVLLEVVIIIPCTFSTLSLKVWLSKCYWCANYHLLKRQFYKGLEWAVVNAVMNLRVPQNVGNFLTSWETVSFSERTLLRGGSFLTPQIFRRVRKIVKGDC
jgi:hypothetical protein